MTIKAVVFDKDGTLIDFSGTFGPATSHVLRSLSRGNEALAEKLATALHFDPHLEACHPQSVLIAGTLEEVAACLAPELDRTDLMELAAEIDALYIQHSKTSLTAFPFTRSALERLTDQQIVLGVATNDSEGAARSHMTQLGLVPFFATIFGADSGHGGKPGAGMILAFADAHGVKPDEVAMVGDSSTDMKAARAAGCLAIAVTSGEVGAEELSPYSDHILRNISELPELLNNLIQGAA